MDRIRFVDHRGTQLLHIDFSGLDARAVEKLVGEAKAFIATQAPGSLRTVTDVSNARFDDPAVASFKEYVRHNGPYVRSAAVVGVTGLKKILLNAVKLFSKRDFALFDGCEPAKDWLASRE